MLSSITANMRCHSLILTLWKRYQRETKEALIDYQSKLITKRNGKIVFNSKEYDIFRKKIQPELQIWINGVRSLRANKPNFPYNR